MFDDDEGFYLDEEDIADEVAMDQIDQEKLKVIDNIKTFLNKISENIKFQETEEEKTNFRLVTNYINTIIELNRLKENSDISNEEIMNAILNIDEHVRKLSYEDVDEIKNKNILKNKTLKDDSTDDDIDF